MQPSRQSPDTPKGSAHQLTFLGAAQEVTGSCYLLRTGNQRLLLECGMHQGGDAVERLEQERFRFDPATIDAVILSHAHLDHSGLLPRLVHEGFDGPIYCTPGTRSLLKILLEDAASLYQRDLDYENLRRQRRGKQPLPALYDPRDVQRVLELCQAVGYGQRHRLAAGIVLTLHDAGHILGAAIVQLELGRTAPKTLVFSGDLGNPDSALMGPPTPLTQADLVLMESTYGDRNHRAVAETETELREILRAAERDHGNILIPSFAVGRAQELIFQLGRFYHEGWLRHWKVFLDSPMAHAVTQLYDHCQAYLDPQDVALMQRHHAGTLSEFLPNLTVCETVEESMAINRIASGAIIIAGSGMCTGGRIRHHLKHRLWQRNNHLVFVGFQARGTLGRILVDGVKRVKLFGQQIAVKSQVHTLGGYSAHAGQRDLLAWAAAFESAPPIWLVHGEADAQAELVDALWRTHGIAANIAARGAVLHF